MLANNNIIYINNFNYLFIKKAQIIFNFNFATNVSNFNQYKKI